MRTAEREDTFSVRFIRPVPLFLRRMTGYWRTIWKCWRTVLDWTVWLYILVPAFFILGGMYLDLARNPPPLLLTVPAEAAPALLGLSQLAAKLRTFADPGDGLFLHRFRRWRHGFALSALMYGMIVRLVSSVILVGVMAPLLEVTWGDSPNRLFLLAASSALFGFVWMLARDTVGRRIAGWRRVAVLILSGFVLWSLFTAAASFPERMPYASVSWFAAMTAAALWFARMRIHSKGTFQHEITVERDAYVANVGWMLTGTLEKKPLPKRRKPFLFARSQSLLKRSDSAGRVADIWLKAFLRRFDLIRFGMSFMGLGGAAVSLTPLPLSGLVLLILPIIFLGWLRSQWNQWLSEPFPSQFRWPDQVLDEAAQVARFRLVVPIVLIWSLIAGVCAGIEYGGAAWIAAAAVPALGWFWLLFVNSAFTSLNFNRRRNARRTSTADVDSRA